MPPLWDQTGVPVDEALAHFHSSTTSGSASWMSSRTSFSTEPRQSPSSRMRSSIICEAELGVRELPFRGTGRPLKVTACCPGIWTWVVDLGAKDVAIEGQRCVRVVVRKEGRVNRDFHD